MTRMPGRLSADELTTIRMFVHCLVLHEQLWTFLEEVVPEIDEEVGQQDRLLVSKLDCVHLLLREEQL